MTKSDRQPSKKWEKQKDGVLNYADDCGMGIKVIVKVKKDWKHWKYGICDVFFWVCSYLIRSKF